MKINVFDIASIEKAISSVKQTKQAMKGISREVMQELVDLGVEKAKQLCPLYSGETYDSITGYVTEDGKGVIVAGGNAAWIEFGTGIKGANEPYPGDPKMMKGATPYNGYMSGDQIYEPKDGRIGWNYYDEKAGKWSFKEGMPSRPFMWETAHYIRSIAPGVVKVKLKHLPYGMRH